jgi:DNA repair protein RecO (recombination protein O)
MGERIYRTQALILRRSNFGEADRLLLLATPGGKRRVVAKGVRKTTSRLAGHIELFTHTSLMLARGRNLDIITQSQVVQHFAALRADLERLGGAYYVADLYDALTQEEENRALFALLVQAFAALDATQHPDLVLRRYELHVFTAAGYRPQLHQCPVCRELLTPEAEHFSPALGGVLCPRDASADRAALPIGDATFRLLRYLQREPFEALERLKISPEVRAEAALLVRAYIRYVLERDLKSSAFLESLASSDSALVRPPT